MYISSSPLSFASRRARLLFLSLSFFFSAAVMKIKIAFSSLVLEKAGMYAMSEPCSLFPSGGQLEVVEQARCCVM